MVYCRLAFLIVESGEEHVLSSWEVGTEQNEPAQTLILILVNIYAWCLLIINPHLPVMTVLFCIKDDFPNTINLKYYICYTIILKIYLLCRNLQICFLFFFLKSLETSVFKYKSCYALQ